jgi:3-hydroxybutyryl-CoA dehydrogenase
VSDGPPHRVTVLGAGTMGSGIALSFARAGSSVKLTARRGSTLQAARARISETVEVPVAHRILDEAEAGRAVARISTTQDLEDAVRDVELVVESVVEDLDVKRDVLARAQRAASPGTVLVTDTSSIAIDDLAAALDRPQYFAGMHWFNPAELVSLVEIVSGSRTERAVAEQVVAWTRALGKRPVHLRRDIAGFIANRIQYAVFREAFALVKEGVCDYADVDETMKAGLGARWAAIGPFESLDLAGLDVHEAVARRLYPLLSNDREPAPTVTALVAEGHLGCKTGRGLYGNYDDEAIRTLERRRARVLLALAQLNGA